MSTITIDKNDKRLDSVKFLISAMKKNDLRFHIKHFKVETDNSAVSTDGARLHYVKEIDLESGYYVVHKNLKTSVLIEKVYDFETGKERYPVYQDLLKVPDFIQFDYFNKTEDSDPSSLFAEVVRKMKEAVLNFYFVEALCNTMDGIITVSIAEPEKNYNGEIETTQPIHFVKENLHAVIMPKKL